MILSIVGMSRLGAVEEGELDMVPDRTHKLRDQNLELTP